MGRAYSRAMRGALFLCGVSIAVVVAIACNSSVPTPSYVAQPQSALNPVPYPPPPARAETIPKQPSSGAVWVDGEWVWQTRRYSWRKGRWVVPPAGAKFAPWTSVRDKAGGLYVATGTWRNANGDEVIEPPALGEGKPKGGVVLASDGDPVQVGQPASSASATFGEKHVRAAARESEALDASGPPSLASDAAVSEQLLDAAAPERAPTSHPLPTSDASTP